jgi:hypothetical protein
MRLLPLLIISAIATIGGAIPVLSQPQSPDPTFFTGNPPTLVNAGTPDSSVNWPSPRYYFTFQLPSDSPESLAKVSFIPQPSVESIVFNVANTTAFQGTQNQQGKSLAVQVNQAKDGTITAQFNPPVPPGTTFTVSLEAVQNPSVAGVYQFTVQGFPAGPNPTAFDLGVGRFSFYSFR